MSQTKGIGPLIKNLLFTGVESQSIKMNISQSSFLSFKEGDVIFQAGDKSENLFLVLDGEVKLKISSPGVGAIVSEKGKNQFFGEFEVLDNIPRKSAAVANTDCVLYKIPHKELMDLIAAHNVIKENLYAEKNGMNSFVRNNAYQIRQDSDGTGGVIIDSPNLTPEEEFAQEEPDDSASEIDSALNSTSSFVPDLPDTEPAAFNEIEAVDEGEIPDITEETTDIKNTSESALIEEHILEDEDFIPDVNVDFTGINDSNAIPADTITKTEMSLPDNDEDLSGGSIFAAALNGEIDFPDEPGIETPYEVQEEIPLETPSADTEELPEPLIIRAEEFDYPKIISAIQKYHESLELEKIVHSILESLLLIFDVQIARFFIYDHDNDELWSFPFMDNSEEIKKVQIGTGLIGYCAKNLEIINLLFPESDSRFSSICDSVENITADDMLLFPVTDKSGSLAAVVQLINSPGHGFYRHDEEVLEILSPHIYSAILNSGSRPAEVKYLYRDETIKIPGLFLKELNIPLSLINRYAEFISQKAESKDLQQVSEFIIEQAKSISSFSGLVTDFLSGTNNFKGEAIQLKPVLNEILDMFAEYVESNKAKLFKKIDAEVSIFINRDAFYHACFQLIKGICQSMPDGGNIYILAQTEKKTASIEFLATGKGMTWELKDRLAKVLSEPDSQDDLGLAIACRIISNFNGTIKPGPESADSVSIIISLPVYSDYN